MIQNLIPTAKILRQSSKDFFNPYMLKLSFLPLVLSFLFWAVIFYFFAPSIFGSLFEMSKVELMLENGFFSWIQDVLDFVIKVTLFILFVIVFFLLSMLSNLVICAFLAEKVVKFVHRTYYSNLAMEGNQSIFGVVFFLFKAYLLYFFILVLLIPLYFIPFVGAFVMLFPSYWIFKKTLIADVGDMIFEKNSLKKAQEENKKELRKLAISLYALSLIPFLNFFIPFYALLGLSHFFFDVKNKGKL
ncbi:EI24 domain-containing protein [Helicobacter burdigaliensis]|uniref:EI24 domain-containing protein n=1 Tax=Helicobacter burdigaliensis TaxID=2315334 RepID=UPI000EF657A3|nr:EI24 domain-containing protein [Helicobacter burdigaliensis]